MSRAQSRRLAGATVAALAVLVLACSALAQPRTNVAVFNFQMKSQTPDWAWLEKGLADQITTHFIRDGKLVVVARDEMQAVAQKVRWAPELMAGDPERMKEIQKQLKIEYLVTGLYAVEGEQIKITAQIVEMEGRKELARKEAAGPLKDILELQRKLTAELLGWFGKRPAGEILPGLPAWTRSISATKALYEGMDLYDQGRYGEAWLRFRQAAKDDGDYLEAQYWVGKMYYFMDRYEHARRAYERFIYMDPSHPRLGDAIKEYLHTCEKTDAQPEALLKTYADLADRYPTVKIFNEMGAAGWVPNRCWLWTRSAQLLGQMGRHDEAVLLAARAEQALAPPADESAYGIAWSNAIQLNALTGRVLIPEGLNRHWSHYGVEQPLSFTPTRTEAVSMLKWPVQCVLGKTAEGNDYYAPGYKWWSVLAPDGYVFKSIHFYTLSEGDHASTGFALHKDDFADIKKDAGYAFGPIVTVRKNGIRYSNIPRCGLFQVSTGIVADNAFVDPKVKVFGVRAVAELEPIGPHGAIQVTGTNTHDFVADVDGRVGRNSNGLIGLVPPGERALRLRPSREDSPFGEWTAKVAVEEGKTVPVAGALPWKAGSPWASWKPVCIPNSEQSRPPLCLQSLSTAPSIEMDASGIRIFRALAGDLWMSASRDGVIFSPFSRLPMPISTGWTEQDPQCLRDESGRYLLVFRSDRSGAGESRPYACWSRDLEHWSSPAMVLDRSVKAFHVIQDDRGRFLWADATGNKVTVLSSRDAYHWERLAELPLEDAGAMVRLLQRPDGSYELFVAYRHYRTKENRWLPDTWDTPIARYVSLDAATWTPKGEITRVRGDDARFSVLHTDGRTVMVLFLRRLNEPVVVVEIFREDGNGGWQRSPSMAGVANDGGTIAYHPRWGHVMAWAAHSTGAPNLPEGLDVNQLVYLLRGVSLEPFFEPAMPAASGAKP